MLDRLRFDRIFPLGRGVVGKDFLRCFTQLCHVYLRFGLIGRVFARHGFGVSRDIRLCFGRQANRDRVDNISDLSEHNTKSMSSPKAKMSF